MKQKRWFIFSRYATRFQQQHVSERHVIALGAGAATPHEAASRDGAPTPAQHQQALLRLRYISIHQILYIDLIPN